MEDDAKEMMEESIGDAVELVVDGPEDIDWSDSEGSFTDIVIALYKERMGRKNSIWMEEQMADNKPEDPTDRGRY